MVDPVGGIEVVVDKSQISTDQVKSLERSVRGRSKSIELGPSGELAEGYGHAGNLAVHA